MNLFVGVFKCDVEASWPSQFDTINLFRALPIEKVLWQPDHQKSYHSKQISFACYQRFITPQCSHQTMPYFHEPSGCIILGDIFLTNRNKLVSQLQCSSKLADCELVLLSYFKWKESFVKYLVGDFIFVIWNPTEQRLIVVADHFATRPCFYSFTPGEFFIFSNIMQSVARFNSKLTLNRNLFSRFSLDFMPINECSVFEISKIAPAELISVTNKLIEKRNYWRISDTSSNAYGLDEIGYYQKFQELFAEVCEAYTRSSYPIAAQISGGLDSSAVAAMAARILSSSSKTLYGFTAIPKDLVGESHRKNWNYNELDKVQALLKRYPNIFLQIFQTDPGIDPFTTLENLYSLTDQPYRNITNLNWILASYAYAADNGSRILLGGQMGNGTISWKGSSFAEQLRSYYRAVKYWLYPEKICCEMFNNLNREFIHASQTRSLIRKRLIIINLHKLMLSRKLSMGLYSSIRSLSLYYGVEYLDPTADLRIVEFCSSLPNQVFRNGSSPTESRLLVREGLKDILPNEIRINASRGEQSADWYLQYNFNAARWKQKIEEHPINSCLWEWYDRDKVLALFRKINKSDLSSTYEIQITLFRCLSLMSYLSYAERIYSNSVSDNRSEVFPSGLAAN